MVLLLLRVLQRKRHHHHHQQQQQQQQQQHQHLALPPLPSSRHLPQTPLTGRHGITLELLPSRVTSRFVLRVTSHIAFQLLYLSNSQPRTSLRFTLLLSMRSFIFCDLRSSHAAPHTLPLPALPTNTVTLFQKVILVKVELPLPIFSIRPFRFSFK